MNLISRNNLHGTETDAAAHTKLFAVPLASTWVLTPVFVVSGWKLSPVVGAVYGPELYAGRA